VVKVLKIALGAEELASIGRAPTDNLDAWQRFMKARQLLRDRRTGADVQEALALVEDAIALDPQFARAHSLRALLLLLRPSWDGGSLQFEMQRSDDATPAEIARILADWDEAIRETGVALQLDPRLGEPHAVRALHAQAFNLYADAHRSFRWALNRGPSNPDIRNWYGSFLLDAGYVQAGLEEKQRAAELDPLSPMIAWQLAYAGIIAGRVDVVESFAPKARANGWPGWQADATHGGAALLRGDLAEAERRWIAAMPQHTEQIRTAVAVIRARQIDARAAAMLAKLTPYGPPGRARYSTQVFAGDVDGALETIGTTIDPDSLRSAGNKGPVRPAKGERPGSVLRADWWFVAQRGDAVRRDPRFVALMEEIGLVDFWRQNGWPDHCRQDKERVVCD
jgi:tetratricopeptide (TPR) repeat protein